MSHPLDVLERLAREGEPTPETLRLMGQLPADVCEAIRQGDAGALGALLHGRSTMACMITLPDNDMPLPEEDEPAQPEDEPQERPPGESQAA
ncbi:MAG: hypothetical protein ACOY37_01280 [Pseudomonadota bacterium]